MSSKSQLVFESTVAKSLVHKRAIAEVLITDSLQLYLANRLIDGQNRLIILHHSLRDEDSRVCEDLEGRSTAIVSAE